MKPHPAAINDCYDTLVYLKNNAGVHAEIDIYQSNMHAFDMMRPESNLGRQAAEAFNKHFEYARDNYFAEN